MSETTVTLYEHPARPTWGRCVLVAERDGKVFLHCEDGAEHIVAATHKGALAPVSLDPAQATAISETILGHRSAQANKARPRAKKKAGATQRPNFEQQVDRFVTAFPGGFTDEKFIADERGVAGSEGSWDTAIGRAGSVLSAAALQAEGAFANILTFLQETAIVHPMEGPLPLKQIPEADRQGFVGALRELLHGAGDHAGRFDAFVAAVRSAGTDGAVKRPSWPLTTLFPALHNPKEHAYIKPKLLLVQADILGTKIEYQSTPGGASYEQFRDVLKNVSERLITAGHAPRDLLDVGTFVQHTLKTGATLAETIAAAD